MAVLMAYVIWCPALAPILLMFYMNVVFSIHRIPKTKYIIHYGIVGNSANELIFFLLSKFV